MKYALQNNISKTWMWNEFPRIWSLLAPWNQMILNKQKILFVNRSLLYTTLTQSISQFPNGMLAFLQFSLHLQITTSFESHITNGIVFQSCVMFVKFFFASEMKVLTWKTSMYSHIHIFISFGGIQWNIYLFSHLSIQHNINLRIYIFNQIKHSHINIRMYCDTKRITDLLLRRFFAICTVVSFSSHLGNTTDCSTITRMVMWVYTKQICRFSNLYLCLIYTYIHANAHMGCRNASPLHICSLFLL